jgi:hypothetical protein
VYGRHRGSPTSTAARLADGAETEFASLLASVAAFGLSAPAVAECQRVVEMLRAARDAASVDRLLRNVALGDWLG